MRRMTRKGKKGVKNSKNGKDTADSEAASQQPVQYRVDAGGVRHVVPYVHTFKTFAKGRWVGREILEVLLREFGSHPKEYWVNAMKHGFVRVNDKMTHEKYIFRNNDSFYHMTHRHEPAVVGNVTFVGSNGDLFAVNKPASMPMHPCGAYRANSMLFLLEQEPIVPDQPKLQLVHRLDRVTSGLVVLATNKEAAHQISQDICDGRTEKTYVARVRGRFASSIEFMQILPESELVCISSNSNETENDNEPLAGKKRKFEEAAAVDISVPVQTEGIPLSDVRASAGVGVGTSEKYPGWTLLACPLQVVSHREGIHCCDPKGKKSLSCFKELAYDAESNTSLVLCRPVTGRTHQLRLHLQLLGNPIANDPCYGGSLFAEEPEKFEHAVDALQRLHELGIEPISRIPSLASIKEALQSRPTSENSKANSSDASDAAMLQAQALTRGEGEDVPSFMARTCRYCLTNGREDGVNLERALHCDGIWLHALRYRKVDHWDFCTPLPPWTAPFSCAHPFPEVLRAQEQKEVKTAGIT